jgi:hypothetical protein
MSSFRLLALRHSIKSGAEELSPRGNRGIITLYSRDLIFACFRGLLISYCLHALVEEKVTAISVLGRRRAATISRDAGNEGVCSAFTKALPVLFFSSSNSDVRETTSSLDRRLSRTKSLCKTKLYERDEETDEGIEGIVDATGFWTSFETIVERDLISCLTSDNSRVVEVVVDTDVVIDVDSSSSLIFSQAFSSSLEGRELETKA